VVITRDPKELRHFGVYSALTLQWRWPGARPVVGNVVAALVSPVEQRAHNYIEVCEDVGLGDLSGVPAAMLVRRR
jgi:hypothetical protein